MLELILWHTPLEAVVAADVVVVALGVVVGTTVVVVDAAAVVEKMYKTFLTKSL